MNEQSNDARNRKDAARKAANVVAKLTQRRAGTKPPKLAPVQALTITPEPKPPMRGRTGLEIA